MKSEENAVEGSVCQRELTWEQYTKLTSGSGFEDYSYVASVYLSLTGADTVCDTPAREVLRVVYAAIQAVTKDLTA